MIFLDEPTSGLDGQSAYNTVRFLRKLADVGQAVLVGSFRPLQEEGECRIEQRAAPKAGES
jgi:ABC-type multidrug transport system ATPase subunit